MKKELMKTVRFHCLLFILFLALGTASCKNGGGSGGDADAEVDAGDVFDGIDSHGDGFDGVDLQTDEGHGCSDAPAECTPLPGATVTWDTAVLRIDENGQLMDLTSTESGTSIVSSGSSFCRLGTDDTSLDPDGWLDPVSATQCGDRVTFSFPSGYSLDFQVATGAGYSYWELCELGGDLDRIHTARLAALRYGAVDGCRGVIMTCDSSGFSAGVMATAVNVRADLTDEGALAETTSAHGLDTGGFGIVAAPTSLYTRAIEAFEMGAGVPSPHPEGVWSKESPATRRSYLFIMSGAASQAGEIADWAARGHFGAVLLGNWSTSFGHHEVNTDLFPDGIGSVTSLVQDLRGAIPGLHVGLHFMAPSVSLFDAYVTPVPDRRLVKDLWATLAGDVSSDADFLPTVEPTDGFPTEDGGYMGKGRFLQVDDEIIEYASLETSPNGFHVLQRGALGTTASAHASGARVGHLLRSYDHFLFDLDTDMAAEVAGRVAQVANAAGIDMIYMDGSESLQGDHWYYNAKLQETYYRALANPDTFLQGSSFSPYSWHIISRTASADGHGDIKAYLDERLPSISSTGDYYLPLDIGWYYLFDLTATEDQFEYILQKCLGLGASVSIETSVDSLNDHPVSDRVIDMVGVYEDLRLGGTVPSDILEILKQPGIEYRLLDDPLRLRRVVFVRSGGPDDGDWRPVTALDGSQNVFSFTPAAAGCMLGVQVRSGELTGPGASYQSAPMVDDLSNPAAYDSHSDSPGVTSQLTLESADCAGSIPCAQFSAQSPADDGWSYFGRDLDPDIDLSTVAAFGLWLKGDGNGGSFKLQFTRDAEYLDYYVNNDFTGWKYVQLLRPADKTFVATRTGLYYNGLPAGSVTCIVDDIKALTTLDAGVVNPAIQVDGQGPGFATGVMPGERLVYFPGSEVEIIPAHRGTSQWLPVPSQEITLSGDPATVTFSAQTPLAAPVEVRLVEDCPEELFL